MPDSGSTISAADRVRRAEENLKRQLEWISRYDTRSSLTVGICVGMLGMLATVTPKIGTWDIMLWIACPLAVALLLACLAFMYLGQFPRTNSPNASLLFFGTIAKLKSDEFSKGFQELSDDDYVHDLLCQAHVNAGIVNAKFGFLKRALVCLILSAVPWAVTIYLSKSA